MIRKEKRNSKLRVLLAQHEILNWRSALSWSYTWHLGIEEGLEANGVEFFTLTSPWFSCWREICNERKFDQVWINDISHLCERGDIGEPEIEWLAGLASVRIGFCIESLDYPPEVYAAYPFLKERLPKVEMMLKYVTHCVTTDEKDAVTINARYGIPAIWAPLNPVPERYICQQPPKPSKKVAIFSGTLYGERKKWLEIKELKNILVCPNFALPPDYYTPYPYLFNWLHNQYLRLFARKNRLLNTAFYFLYLYLLRHIRRRTFAIMLRSIQSGVAVVNLPSLGMTYTGRIYEGMAVGRPVISWEVPDRPRNRALFDEGKEILLYRKENPLELVDHIQHILSDPDFGRRIVENGQRKLRSFHTSKKRIQQILKWIDNGEVPVYG